MQMQLTRKTKIIDSSPDAGEFRIETAPVVTHDDTAHIYSQRMFTNCQYSYVLKQSFLFRNQQPWLLCDHIDYSSAHSLSFVRGVYLTVMSEFTDI
jgi:hypothetical protein